MTIATTQLTPLQHTTYGVREKEFRDMEESDFLLFDTKESAETDPDAKVLWSDIDSSGDGIVTAEEITTFLKDILGFDEQIAFLMGLDGGGSTTPEQLASKLGIPDLSIGALESKRNLIEQELDTILDASHYGNSASPTDGIIIGDKNADDPADVDIADNGVTYF